MEKIDIRSSSNQAKLLGTIIAVSGAMVFTFYRGPEIIHMNPSPDSHNQLLLSQPSNWVFGGLLVLTAVVFASIWNVLKSETAKEYLDQPTIVFFYCLFGTISCIALSPFLEQNPSAWVVQPGIQMIAIVCGAIFSTAFRTTAATWCLQKKGPVFVTMFTPLSIVIEGNIYQKPFVLNLVAYPILNSGSMRYYLFLPYDYLPGIKCNIKWLFTRFVHLPWQNQSNKNSSVVPLGPSAAPRGSGALHRGYSSASGQLSSGIFSSGLGNSGINAAAHSLDPEDMEPSSVKLLSGSSVHSGMGGIGSHNFENEAVLSSFSSVSAPELHIPEFMIANDAKEAEIQSIIGEVPGVILRCISRDEAASALLLRRSLKVCMRIHQIQLMSVLILLC